MKTITLLLTSLAFLASASAQTAPAPAKPTPTPARKLAPIPIYKAPQKPTRNGQRNDSDAGSRGGQDQLPSLYVLAPNHTGLTTKAQPTLFFFQSAPTNVGIYLTITEPKKAQPVLKAALKGGKGGIQRVSVARHGVSLAPGVTYKWSIALVPDPASRSLDVIASGFIQRLEPDAKLTAALDAAPPDGKAAIYATHSIWYDTLEAISDQINAASKDRALRSQRAALLAQVGLKEAAAADRR